MTSAGDGPGLAGRLVAAALTLTAVAAVGWVLFAGGGAYTVTAPFLSAAQVVEGNEVRLGGVAVGSVSSLELAPNGEAEIELEIDDSHAPLKRGTRAVIRQTSLSGIANRYVDLQLPRGESGGEIPDGGEIPTDETQAAVELDELFETLDEDARADLQRVLKGFAKGFEGKGEEAKAGYRYLNPALGSTRRLFGDLTEDTQLLERFVVDSAGLVTTLAGRRNELAALIGNLNETTRAIGADKQALAEAIERFPGFMRRAQSTFGELRGTLDDVDPLVTAAKPVAPKLQPFFGQLRAFAADAEPTIDDLSATIRRRGRDNDLIDVLRTFPAVADVAVEEKERRGERRPGTFETLRVALLASKPLIAQLRPYTPDLFGWFDDFSHTGAYDALGGFSRTQVYFNLLSGSVGGPQLPIDLQERPSNFLEIARTGQYKRCPGGADVRARDGSNVLSESEQAAIECREDHRAAGGASER